MTEKNARRAVHQLKILLDSLGTYGGRIESFDSKTCGTLEVRVTPEETGATSVFLDLYKERNGKQVCSPGYHLLISTAGEEYAIVIACYTTQAVFGEFIQYSDEIFYSTILPYQKDRYGNKKKFADFLQYLTVDGPYLTTPRKVIKYDTKDDIEKSI